MQASMLIGVISTNEREPKRIKKIPQKTIFKSISKLRWNTELNSLNGFQKKEKKRKKRTKLL